MTAVEWLVSQLNKQGFAQVVTDEEIQQALEMEKKQMDKVAGDWWREGADFVSNVKREYVSFNQYYAIKFGKGADL